MRRGDIRVRMLVTAILPVTLLALILVAVFLGNRFGDSDEAHSYQTRLLARQLALASEYGLFSGNTVQLQTLANGALRETDVRSVAIVDLQGQILARAGQTTFFKMPALSEQEGKQFDPASGHDLLTQPIIASQLRLDDLFQFRSTPDKTPPQLLGHVLIEFSHETVLRRQRQMLLTGLAVALGGVLFGALLAVYLGRGVLRPILRVSDMMERIGRGDLSARGAVLPNDPLRALQRGLNQMAERLEAGRDELDRRIAAATLELREKKDEAEKATLAKSRFLAAASHDLRQPTHALGMFVARLAQLPHDDQTRELIGNLEASLHAMQDMLNGLLDISRLDAQAVPVQLSAFALNDIFDQLRADLNLTAVDQGLRLRVRTSAVWVMSDPALLHRILLNLLVNALRYTRHGGVLLACRLTPDPQQVRIEVWDSGIGIAPEHQQAIFTEFYQVGNSERDRNKGLGLGLNIVQRSARLLDHRLQLCSLPGRGSRFSLDVPRVSVNAAPALMRPAQAEAGDDLVGLLLLVIEDDELAREGMVRLLESWGAIVRVADSLATALAQLKAGLEPDVIVSDYRLRDGENGIDVINQLRSAAGVPIAACLMSGNTDPELMQAARAAGLSLLHKPVRPAKLRSLVRSLASHHDEAAGGGLV